MSAYLLFFLFVFLFQSSDPVQPSAGNLYWCQPDATYLVKENRTLPLSSLLCIYLGRSCSAFSGTAGRIANEQCAFSLMTRERSLDLEAETSKQRQQWIEGIQQLLEFYTGEKVPVHNSTFKASQDFGNLKLVDAHLNSLSLQSVDFNNSAPSFATMEGVSYKVTFSIRASGLFPIGAHRLESLCGVFAIDPVKLIFEFIDHTDRVIGTCEPEFEREFSVPYLAGTQQLFLLSLYDVKGNTARESWRLGSCYFDIETLIKYGAKELAYPLTNTNNVVVQSQLQHSNSLLYIKVLDVSEVVESDLLPVPVSPVVTSTSFETPSTSEITPLKHPINALSSYHARGNNAHSQYNASSPSMTVHHAAGNNQQTEVVKINKQHNSHNATTHSTPSKLTFEQSALLAAVNSSGQPEGRRSVDHGASYVPRPVAIDVPSPSSVSYLNSLYQLYSPSALQSPSQTADNVALTIKSTSSSISSSNTTTSSTFVPRPLKREGTLNRIEEDKQNLEELADF